MSWYEQTFTGCESVDCTARFCRLTLLLFVVRERCWGECHLFSAGRWRRRDARRGAAESSRRRPRGLRWPSFGFVRPSEVLQLPRTSSIPNKPAHRPCVTPCDTPSPSLATRRATRLAGRAVSWYEQTFAGCDSVDCTNRFCRLTLLFIVSSSYGSDVWVDCDSPHGDRRPAGEATRRSDSFCRPRHGLLS